MLQLPVEQNSCPVSTKFYNFLGVWHFYNAPWPQTQNNYQTSRWKFLRQSRPACWSTVVNNWEHFNTLKCVCMSKYISLHLCVSAILEYVKAASPWILSTKVLISHHYKSEYSHLHCRFAQQLSCFQTKWANLSTSFLVTSWSTDSF